MRTFIAVPLPAALKPQVEMIQSGMRALGADVGWTSVHSIHLTLKFLGEVDPEVIAPLAAELRVQLDGCLRFELLLGGVGAFPDLRSPRVVWLGLEGEVEKLQGVQAIVEQACIRAGFVAEPGVFRPHLTLGRVRGKSNLQRLRDYIRIGSQCVGNFCVDRVIVYKSTLGPHGARHDALDTIELAKP